MESFFAVTAPGIEPLAAQELERLGLLPEVGSSIERGGVTFYGGLAELYKANLYLRTASRVLVRLGDFYAAGFPEFKKKAGRLAWERYLIPGQTLVPRVTCHKSRLYHSDAVARELIKAIGQRMGVPAQLHKPGDEEADNPMQLVLVRLLNDHCTISIDSSGALLHRRGYRLATAKAPLRETLAAAMLLAAGWDPAAPLLDPFCGSGTIPIEAALLARNLAPGRRRRFAFMDWPGFDAGEWETACAAERLAVQPEAPLIQASDRDAGAIRLAQANAERAGVADSIEFTVQAVSAVTPPAGPGWVVTNPPYGLRVSPHKDLRNLYAQLGNVLRAKCSGWQAAILCSDVRLLGQTGLALNTGFSTVNGGVQVRLGCGVVK